MFKNLYVFCDTGEANYKSGMTHGRVVNCDEIQNHKTLIKGGIFTELCDTQEEVGMTLGRIVNYDEIQNQITFIKGERSLNK